MLFGFIGVVMCISVETGTSHACSADLSITKVQSSDSMSNGKIGKSSNQCLDY